MKTLIVLIFTLNFAVGNPIDKGYDRIDPYKNGLAKVYKGSFVGFIDPTGNVVIACRYHQISDFVNGVAKVMIDNKYGYINQSDEVIVPIKYDFISPFKNGIAQVGIDKRFGLISNQGVELLPPVYDEIGLFNKQGIAKVRIKNKERRIKYSGDAIEFVEEEE